MGSINNYSLSRLKTYTFIYTISFRLFFFTSILNFLEPTKRNGKRKMEIGNDTCKLYYFQILNGKRKTQTNRTRYANETHDKQNANGKTLPYTVQGLYKIVSNNSHFPNNNSFNSFKSYSLRFNKL